MEREVGTGTSQFGREPLSLYVVVENTRMHPVRILRQQPVAAAQSPLQGMLPQPLGLVSVTPKLERPLPLCGCSNI